MSESERKSRLAQAFEGLFGRPPALWVRAPGRVNLIGEHTDYNDGWVLPLAIERDIWIAFSPQDARRVTLHTLDRGETAEFPLEGITHDAVHPWSNYARGVALELQAREVPLRGLQAALQSTIPIGAGLSSSAALEVSVALALLAVAPAQMDPVELALLCQRAENRFVGVQSGIMDQMACILGQAGHALLIDCRSLEHRAVPIPRSVRVVICDTMTRRSLAASAYNERREQCREAVRLLATALPGIRALRDVTLEDLRRYGDLLPPVLLRRARHVVSENERVLLAVDALQAGDVQACGRLMDASHASLRDDFEVSSPALDLMVDLARGLPGILGARMTGAGFGGATVNLVRAEAAPAFVQSISAAYQARTRRVPEITISQAAPGASLFDPAKEV